MVDNTTTGGGGGINSLAQILSAMQNGVTAINNLTASLNGVFAGSGVTTTGGGGTIATTTTKFSAISLFSSISTTLTSASSTRYGILFHNPGTANAYVYQTGMSPTPSASLAIVAGSIVIYPGGTLTFPSAYYPNINAGFSAFMGSTVAANSSSPFTVVEFF